VPAPPLPRKEMQPGPSALAGPPIPRAPCPVLFMPQCYQCRPFGRINAARAETVTGSYPAASFPSRVTVAAPADGVKMLV